MSEGERVDADCFDVGDLTITVGRAYLLRDDSGCTVLARVTNIVQDGLNPTSIRAAYLWGHRSRGAFDELGPTEFLMVAGRFAKEVIRIPDPVPALQARIAELEGERDKLLSIKRLFTNYCNKIVELADWSAEGNGNLDLEWAADKVSNALSNAHLIDIGAYRPGVFMPPEAEEEPPTPAAAKEQ